MLVELTSATTGTIQIPADTSAGGLGNFSWDGAAGITTSVEVTIPANTPVGTYDLELTCFEIGAGEWGSGIGVAGDFRVAAAPAPAPVAPLPDTGQDDSAKIFFSGLAAAVLLALGTAFIVVRRRVS
jgi:LPXTG-motif cell wall-anchored protein